MSEDEDEDVEEAALEQLCAYDIDFSFFLYIFT